METHGVSRTGEVGEHIAETNKHEWLCLHFLANYVQVQQHLCLRHGNYQVLLDFSYPALGLH